MEGSLPHAVRLLGGGSRMSSSKMTWHNVVWYLMAYIVPSPTSSLAPAATRASMAATVPSEAARWRGACPLVSYRRFT